MPERIIGLANEISNVASNKLRDIQAVTRQTKILAINALIEAAHVGQLGAGFAVVAQEVGKVSEDINKISVELETQLATRAVELNKLGSSIVAEIPKTRGTRLSDLALNMIEIIDRNLYERSCDVRWWATDSAVVDCAKEPSDKNIQHASKRLGVILDSYTVYLDLWVVDAQGRVLANGRPQKYPMATRENVSGEEWFRKAMATRDGTEFTVADISPNRALDNRLVATYATAVREEGEANGRIIGVLGIFFDWQAQSQTVVDEVHLSDEEKALTRCMILDAKHKVIAASDKKGILSEAFPLLTGNRKSGHYSHEDGSVIGFSLTPGYETYKGLGWYGVIAQGALPKKKQEVLPTTTSLSVRR